MSATTVAVTTFVGGVAGTGLGLLILWRFPRLHRMIYRWYVRREYRRSHHGDHH